MPENKKHGSWLKGSSAMAMIKEAREVAVRALDRMAGQEDAVPERLDGAGLRREIPGPGKRGS